jgi:uncharacterized membrane protein YraQ (UPF0718 family)
MRTPVYVVTGFLGSGKTTFISQMLHSRNKTRTLVIQFEDGEETLDNQWIKESDVSLLVCTREELERDYEDVMIKLTEEIEMYEYKEIWVEWNGMEAFSKLEEILLQLRLASYLQIERVIYIADVVQTEMMLGQTGEGPISQVASSDMVVLRGENNREKQTKRLKQKLKDISSSVEITCLSEDGLEKKIKKRKYSQNTILSGSIFLMAAAFVAVLFFQQQSGAVNKVLTLFMGVFLQAAPFLVLGVLLSSAIQVFLPAGWMEKFFPKSPFLGMAAGLFAGFFLPVCDCASIPVFKSLLKKGVPLPAAVCFMAAAPIVNPVVLISTYYAFNSDIRAVVYRTGLGIICSLIIGLSFFVRKPVDYLKTQTDNLVFCSCGCYEEKQAETGPWSKVQLFMRHAQTEFYSVGKYLLIGIFISVIFQVMDLEWVKNLGSSSMPVALFAMMVLAFLLSLCSSSDAVVARSMSGTFNFTSMLGFLVFGAIVDIKNVMMLKGYFKGRFVLRLALTSFLVCYVVVLIFGFLSGGVSI